MQSLTQPELLKKIFAEDGDRNSLPVVNSDAENPQLADLTNGFPPITSEDPDDTGLPPEREDFNALGYLTTSYDYFYQAGGTFTFNSNISTAIGGYPLGARLWYTDGNGRTVVLRSTKGNNTDNFVTNPSYIGTSWVAETPSLTWNNTWTGTNTFSNTITGSITGNAGTVTNGVYTTGNQTIGGTKTFSSTISGSINGNAGSATKLQTSRNINGTAFNGTGNITTASWGTARNISISDSDGTNTGTAVSVNGSGAVTLKLPSTIKASISGNASTVSNGVYTNTAQTISGNKTFTGTVTLNGTVSASSSVKWGIARWSIPNYETASETGLGFISNGHTYTAVMDGTLHLRAEGANAAAQINLVRSNSELELVRFGEKSSSSERQTVWLPVKGGETYKLYGTGTLYAFFCALSAGA